MFNEQTLINAVNVSIGERISVPNLRTISPDVVFVVEDGNTFVHPTKVSARACENHIALLDKTTRVLVYPTVISKKSK